MTILGRCCRLFALILCTATVVAVASSVAAQESIDELVRYVDQAVGDWETPGLTLALVKDGEVVLAKGFGEREHGHALRHRLVLEGVRLHRHRDAGG